MIGNSIVLTGVKPSDLEATNAPVDSYTIIKTPGQDKFTFVPLTGGTGTIPGFNEPYHDNTYKAVETIAIWEHCCKQTYSGIHLLDHADYLFSQANPIIAKKFWQCVYVPVSGYLVTIAPWITFFDGYQSFAYTCDAAIYAITWTYGVDATPTGPALYTAPQQGWSTGWSGATSNWSPAFVFNTNLPAGYYCVEFTLNFGWGWGLGPWTQIYWDNTSPAYFGNAVEDSITPHVGMNMYLNLIMTPQTVAALANANNVATADWIWVATENKNADEDIIIQDRGEITHSWAFNDDAIWYLRDVAWQISLVPWTNVRIIWQWSGTNKIWMWRTQTMTEINITQDLVYYTNTELVAEWSFHVAYGGIQMWGYVNIQISDDNSTRYTLNKSGNINGSGWDNDPGCQAIIPIGKFFKIWFDVAWGATITPRRCRIRPIK